MGSPLGIGGIIGIRAAAPELEAAALALSRRLGIPMAAHDVRPDADGLVMELAPGGLSLARGEMAVSGGFARMVPRLKPGALQRELLVRAAKVKGTGGHPVAVDATAGLGEDALLLAAAGFQVILFERNPVIAALLEDALGRAAGDPALAEAAGRMQLHVADSVEELPRLPQAPDVVFLDPMFPPKKAAASRKKLQVLQGLEAPCGDGGALLEAAMAAHPRKVVVKRPLKGPCLAGRKPSYTLKGTAIRYDCYVMAR